jgi:hypothetical protein
MIATLLVAKFRASGETHCRLLLRLNYRGAVKAASASCQPPPRAL